MSIQKAFELALKTRDKAHAPYSKFKVGSVVKFTNENTLYSGCNVENASFGGTICAERVAITKAISEVGQGRLEFLLVLTDTSPAAAPCGICRQFISEFSDNNTKIYFANTQGIQKTINFNDLLPEQFDKSSLES